MRSSALLSLEIHTKFMKTLPFTRLLSLGFTILAGAASAAEYEPGTGWQGFSFSNLRGPDYYNDEEPFTFTVAAEQQAILNIVPVGTPTAGGGVVSDQRYTVFNHGAPMQRIPEPRPPGNYSIKFSLGQWNIYEQLPLRGRFRVNILPVPQRLTVSPKESGSCLGERAVFNVKAEFGQEPFSYQWYFNGTNLLDGETNSQLRLLNLTAEQAGSYSAIITNDFGSTTSPSATLKVFDACVALNLYAGLSITGLVGRTYSLEYLTNVVETNWTVLATKMMTQPTWLFIDTNTPVEPKKFFRVRLQP